MKIVLISLTIVLILLACRLIKRRRKVSYTQIQRLIRQYVDDYYEKRKL